MSRSRENKDSKTPSSRLRAVFYLIWSADNKGFKDFEKFYDSKMELLIEHYKEILKKVSK